MRSILTAALAGLSIVIAAAAHAQAIDDEAPDVACEVAGYDVIIVNQSLESIPAGTKVEWSVPFARSQGNHTLARNLEAERPVFLTGALGSSYLDPDTDCFASAG